MNMCIWFHVPLSPHKMDELIEERLNTNYLTKIPHVTTMAWNATISGHTQNNHDIEALELSSQMVL